MNRKLSLLFKDTVIFAIGSMGSRLILFFLVPLYTNCLTTEEYGVAELVVTVAELLIPFLTLAIQDGVLRYGLAKEENIDNVIANGMLIWCISILGSLIVVPICNLHADLEEWKWYVCIYIIFRSLNLIEMNYLKVRNLNKLYALFSIIQTFCLAGMNMLFLLKLNLGILGYLLANICSFIISDICVFIFSHMESALKRSVFDFGLMKKMIVFSCPIIFTNISWWVVNSSDKVMIEWCIGTSALGLYTVAAKLPSFINVLTNVFSQAWRISSVREVESSNDALFYKSVFEKFIIIIFGACICIVSFIKPFMKIYVGADFI